MAAREGSMPPSLLTDDSLLTSLHIIPPLYVSAPVTFPSGLDLILT